MRLRLIAVWLIAAAISSSGSENGIISFTATPRRIAPGASVTLKWVTHGMPGVSLDWAPAAETRDHWEHRGGLPPSGALEMKPEHDTVYVLTCESPGGASACASATVQVRVEPK